MVQPWGKNVSEKLKQIGVMGWIGLAAWFVIIALPLGWLYATLRFEDLPGGDDLPLGRYLRLLGRSCLFASVVASVSCLIGWPAGRLVGASLWARRWGPLLLCIPLLIPPQVLYYSWGLLLLPTSRLGQILSGSDAIVSWVAQIRGVLVLGCWYWPLCALVLGMGWGRTDPDVWAHARMDAPVFRRWWSVGLPMVQGSLVSAWLLTFVLVLAQFSVFHLAAADTLGTELATLYQLTGSVHAVAWAALPLPALALLVSLPVDRLVGPVSTQSLTSDGDRCWRGLWIPAAGFWMLSAVVPTLLLVAHVQSWRTFVRFGKLSWDSLLSSFLIAVVASALAIVISVGVLRVTTCKLGPISKFVRLITFVAALVPGSLVGSAMILAFNRGLVGRLLYNQPWMVSLGHAARLSIIAVLVIWWIQSSLPGQLGELAKLDGAEGFRGAYYVWLPGLWPAIAAAMLVAIALSMTELSATMVLLPAGVPNFAQQLLNQMHYARDQQVIASCIVLIVLSVTIAVSIFLILRVVTGRSSKRIVVPMLLCCAVGGPLVGCGGQGSSVGRPKVLDVFGSTGRGEVQFIYPRAITIAPDNTLFVVDKTARVRHLTGEGKYLGGWTMPAFQAGKPVGLSCGPDGKVYVADTHYHRVMIYSPTGKLVGQFGSYGVDGGQFIYPTDVAVAADGRIFVSEYGGNDRVSIFSPDGKFLQSFGSFGEGEGRFSRPSALCMDYRRGRLYVADACNHRIACYDLEGKLRGVIGSVGMGPGQLRYPYDVNLVDDDKLLVCEYGNNRLQLFSIAGNSLGVWGEGGREPGQLLHPWGAVADRNGRVFVVDSGNDRIQVWRLR